MSNKPLIYVCSMSNFNVAELEACITLAPEHLVLVVSDDTKVQAAAARFESVIKSCLPNSQIHRPDKDAMFNGEDIRAFQAWIQQTLSPRLQAIAALLADPHVMLNITGGTKAMGIALLTARHWDEVHYKAKETDYLQCMTLDGSQWLPSREHLSLQSAKPLDVARLYAEDITPNQTGLEATPAQILLAQRIWHELSANESGITALFSWLDSIWSEGRNASEYNDTTLTLPLPSGLLQQEAVIKWIHRFSQLAPGWFSLDGEQLTLPGNKARKKSKYVRKWISGDWLEHLTYQWLKDAGVPESCMAAGVTSKPLEHAGSVGDRETDLFIHHKGQSYVIEVKADIPDSNIKETERQITSLGNRLGMTKKILLVGPQFQHRAEHEGRWEYIKLLMKANNVSLCSNKEQLINALKLSLKK